MVRAMDTAFAAMCLSVATVVLVEFLDQLPDSGTTTSTQPLPLTTSAQLMLPLAATVTAALFAAVALVLRHLINHAAGRDRCLSELVTFMLCTSVAILAYVIFLQPAGVIVIDVGARAQALGMAATRMLPAAATVTFFLGVSLVLVHVRAGDGPVVRILSKMVLEAAAILIGLVAMVIYTTY